MRAVILPAIPLLVPGLVPGLPADPLAGVRSAVRSALTELTTGGRLPLVLAHGRALRHGRMRPSLTGSGIGDRWLPAPAATFPTTGRPAAGTGASVALLSLAAALGTRVVEVETLEVPSDADTLDPGTVELLRGADGLVVAGGGAPGGLDSGPDALTAGLRAALQAAGADAWRADVQVFTQAHEQLPPEYRVTILS